MGQLIPSSSTTRERIRDCPVQILSVFCGIIIQVFPMNVIKFGLTISLAVGIAHTAHAKFEETKVSVTPEVAGKLVVPAESEIKKAVLLLHGFNSHMDEVGDLYKQLAHDLAEERIGSLRINFRGEGVRNNSVITSTLESRKEDAENAYRFLKKQFPDALTGVNGWSMGGNTAIILMGTHPDWFKSAVLWSSGGHNLKDSISQRKDPAHAAMLKKTITEGSAVYQGWVDITYTRENYVSWIGYDSADYLQHYRGAFLGIRGTEDFLPLHETDWMTIIPGKQSAYHVLAGADHIFNVLGPGESQGEEVVNLTVRRFAETLK